eukprot:1142679-Pelagomonas_calceolata.AAC.4
MCVRVLVHKPHTHTHARTFTYRRALAEGEARAKAEAAEQALLASAGAKSKGSDAFEELKRLATKASIANPPKVHTSKVKGIVFALCNPAV